MSDQSPDKEKYKELYQVCKNAFDAEMQRIDSIDRKAQANLTLVGLLLGAGVFKLDFLLQTKPTENHILVILWIILLTVTTGLLLASVFFSIQTLQMRHFKTYPKLDDLLENFIERPVESLHLSMADHFRKVLPENEQIVARKIQHLKRAILLTKPSLIGLALFLGLSIGHYIMIGPQKESSYKMQNQGKPTPPDPSPPSQPQSKPQSEKPEVVPLTPQTVERGAPKQ